MQDAPLMPKATAVWLVENTALSFDQVAEFCKLHPLEVKAIADGDAAQGIKGLDPIQTGQLTREEIDKAVADPAHKLQLSKPKVDLPEPKTDQQEEGPALHPGVAPAGPAQRHPVADPQSSRAEGRQIMRLVGTTKSTIQGIRDRTHWNAASLTPLDPVTLGLCSQIDLDFEVQRASKEKPVPADSGVTLLPAAVTTAPQVPVAEPSPAAAKAKDDLDTAAVFAKLKQLGGNKPEDKDE